MAGDRFFVTVFARDRAALRQLADFDLDLFQATARAGTRARNHGSKVSSLWKKSVDLSRRATASPLRQPSQVAVVPLNRSSRHRTS